MGEKNDTQEEVLRGKRIVRMALLANFLTMTAAMLGVTVGPKICMELDTVLSGCPVGASSPEEHSNCIAGIAGELGGKFASLGAFTSLLSAGALGMLSDVFGRKPFLIASTLGVCMDMCGMIFGVGGTPGGTTVTFLVKALAGLLGSQDIFLKAALADVSSPEDAPANFAAVIANVGLALLFAGIGGEVVVAAFGTLKAGGVFGLVCGLIAVALFVAMPEPSANNRSKQVRWALANPFGSMAFLFSKSYFILFALMSLLEKTATNATMSNLGIFCMTVFGEETPFVLLLLFIGIGLGVVCGVLLPRVLPKIGVFNCIKLGLIFNGFGYLTVIAVTQTRQFNLMFVAFGLLTMSGLALPTQASAVTLCAAASEQGTLQAAIGSMEILARTIGPLVGAMVWKSAAPAGNFTYIWWVSASLTVPAVVIAFALPGALPAELARLINGGKDEHID